MKRIAFITDSIAGDIYHDKLEKITKAKITKVKAYGAVEKTRAEGYRFPKKNFAAVVPNVLASGNYDTAVFMAPSVHLTNLPKNTSDEQASVQAEEASNQMIKISVDAIKKHPNLKKLIVIEAAPRYDQWHELNEHANEQLHEALENIDSEEVKSKIVIGRHNLACEGGLRLSRYGDPDRVKADGIHLRGSSGNIAMTRSIASVLAGAGLASVAEAEALGRSEASPQPSPISAYQTQRGRRPAPRQEQRQFELPTHNRFGPLGF